MEMRRVIEHYFSLRYRYLAHQTSLLQLKILQLTKKFPWPPHDGEAIAISNLTRTLSELGHEVTVFALNTKKHHFKIEDLPDEMKAKARWMAVDIDTSVRAWDALGNLFSSKSYNIERFFSPQYEMKLGELLSKEKFDIIQLETLYMARYVDVIQANTRAPIVLRSHNLEYEIWERRAINETSLLKTWYLQLLARRLKAFEEQMLGAYEAIVPISPKDAERYALMGEPVPMHVCPVGVDQMPVPESDFEFPSVFFLGGLDWAPNTEGLEWFLDEVWPVVYSKYPACNCYVAGRNASVEWLNFKQTNVTVLGEIEDASAFMNSKAIMIVPLFSGSGMRVKIVEALNHGKAIVTTSIGAEGIAAVHNHDLMVADTTEEFISALSVLIADGEKVKMLGINGAKFVRQHFDNLTIAQNLIDFYEREVIN